MMLSTRALSFINNNNNVNLTYHITSLPLKEKCIIAKSIELFNYNQPCIIYKSFCIKSLYLEIKEYFDVLLSKGQMQVLWSSLPNYICEMLDINVKIDYILISYVTPK